MRKKIDYPPFVFAGIQPNHRATPRPENLKIFGGDNETYFGQPHTVQIFDGVDLLFEYVEPSTVFRTWTDYLFDKSRSRGVNICYVHFLRFDTPVIFYEKRLAMYEQISEIKFDFKGYECEILFGKINKVSFKRKDRTVHLFDSWSFTQASLARSLDMYKIESKKLEKSKALQKAIGRVRFNELKPSDPLRVEFEQYGKVDAISEYHLGRAIMGFHERYNVRPSISLPQFAARVFRHHFFKSDESIPFPPAAVVEASELSYHGGKNGFYLDKPQVIENAYEIDISSAYPYAMKKIPQMVKGRHIGVREYVPGLVGVYKVSGEDLGKYPLVFDHEFKRPAGPFKDLWLTSYELEKAFTAPDVRLTVEAGHVWEPDPSQRHNPLVEYVDHFYELKQKTPKDDPNYHFYKIMLNGLYGKFLQTTEIRRLEEVLDKPKSAALKRLNVDYTFDKVLGKFIKVSHSWRAGGLYNPFIATLITGYVRAMLYDMEVKYEAFHSATDAVKTTKKPVGKPGLGGFKIETFGRCYAFRNKLYLHFAKGFGYCGHDPKKCKTWDRGEHLCKFGLHGFKGTVQDLYEAKDALLRGDEYAYSYDHMVGLREGFKKRETICSMIERKETIKL